MKIIGVLMLAASLALTSPAAAEQIFDFDGQTNDAATIGDTATMLSKIVNGIVLNPPLPLDTVNYEYTLVVTGLQLVSVSGPISTYGGGTIRIYQDNTTAADYGNPSSFSDGVVMLEGSLSSFGRNMFSSMLGAGSGTVDWTAGTRIGEIHPADRIGWSFLVSVSRSATVTLPGFDERWDGKVEPLELIISSEAASFGQLKGSY